MNQRPLNEQETDRVLSRLRDTVADKTEKACYAVVGLQSVSPELQIFMLAKVKRG